MRTNETLCSMWLLTAITVKPEMAEATGITYASSIRPDGRCRIPFPDLRADPAPDVRWASRRDESTRSRYRARTRRLTAEQESTIRALVATRSLRSLAAEFGVSHETIRAVVRQGRDAATWVPRDSGDSD